jgi:hypothetical protein
MAIDSGPGRDAAAVTKSDTTTIGGCRALYVGMTGDLTIDTVSTTNIVFKAVPAGTILPVAVLRVKAATTAADIVAIY